MSKLLKWIVNIILLAAIVIACALLVPPLVGITTVMVDDVEMSTNLPKGSVTYAKEQKLENLEVGDRVLVTQDGGEYVYQLKKIDTATGACELEDKESSGGENKTVEFRKDVPKVVLTVPFIAYIVMAMKSTEGLIMIGLAVVFVIILFILAELWKPDEDEEVEEEEEAQSTTPKPEERLPERPAQILEAVNSEIASTVSSVVAQEAASESRKQEAKGQDLTVTQETPVLVEASADSSADKLTEAEAETPAEKPETEPAPADEAETMAEPKDEPAEPQSENVAEGPAESQEAILEAVTEEEESSKRRELAMPVVSAAELIQKAKEAGDEPIVVVDEELGVTLLDYSDII